MQALPVLSAEAANRPCSRGQGQGNHEDEGGESYGDEWAFDNVFQHFVDVEELVEPDVGGEMETTVEESEQSDHAADADQPVLTGDPAERRDGEGGEDKNQRPVPGRVRDELDGIGAEAAMQRSPYQAPQRNERGEEDGDFCQTQFHFRVCIVVTYSEPGVVVAAGSCRAVLGWTGEDARRSIGKF